ncbi:HNH/ENDO VII family nuclease [Saccharococcus sp. Marseille-Q5394]|uniref:HNH/ENDO VII family nuclease n=1 Tax=Saccharococcus sp. Marseille-Q5394 TaxID=2972778 RepID=UPI0021C5D618|nr:HNH/ENDO VII family nuclease [Saccharococcus sp. Marseille-Q5394]
MIEMLAKEVIEIPNQEVLKGSSDVPTFAKGMAPETITSYDDANLPIMKEYAVKDVQDVEGMKNALTDGQKLRIKEESGYSDEVIAHISSWEEYEVYSDAGLKETTINGRPCLIRDIDMDYVDQKTGLTNRELMEKGLSPIDAKTGEKIELHHIGQEADSPFAELTADSEHGKEYKTLHTKETESWRNDTSLKNQYNNVERPNHWKSRATEEVGV